MCELYVGLRDEVGDAFYSCSDESLAFFATGTGDENDGVVALDGTIGSELHIPL